MDNIRAVDKFVAEATNYCLVEADYFSKKVYVPQFLAEVEWGCNREHLIGKWLDAVACQEPSAYLVKFYCQLDGGNKERLINWIIEHGEHQFMY